MENTQQEADTDNTDVPEQAAEEAAQETQEAPTEVDENLPTEGTEEESPNVEDGASNQPVLPQQPPENPIPQKPGIVQEDQPQLEVTPAAAGEPETVSVMPEDVSYNARLGRRLRAQMQRKRDRQIKEHQLPNRADKRPPSPDLVLQEKPKDERLYKKYKVTDMQNRHVANAFIMRPDVDPIASDVLRAYADHSECPATLRKDIHMWLDRLQGKYNP